MLALLVRETQESMGLRGRMLTERSMEHGRTSVRVLQTRNRCANSGLRTMTHWDLRVLYKGEHEIPIGAGGCKEVKHLTRDLLKSQEQNWESS